VQQETVNIFNIFKAMSAVFRNVRASAILLKKGGDEGVFIPVW
jgi:hypothetical protein